MPTFGQLRKKVMEKAGVADHFQFRGLNPKYVDFWDKMNKVEYEKGYTPEYTKPGSPALCDMELLTEDQFNSWVAEFEESVLKK